MNDIHDTGVLAKDVGRRLQQTREALRIKDQERFGAPAGISQPSMSMFESGARPLTLPAALRICATYNLTLDWLYRGDPQGLPRHLADKIGAIQDRLPLPEKPKRKRQPKTPA